MLKVENINLYYGAAQALRGVSLSAEPGKVTCVLGRNGVGKTSLLRAMVGQYPIASGSITFDGTDISGLRPYERAPRRRPVRRPAAATCHRTRAGDAAEIAAARRADRGHSAIDHQGHRAGDLLSSQPRQHRDRTGRTIPRLR